jgi:tetratricopeptide (TPR) repeat protein
MGESMQESSQDESYRLYQSGREALETGDYSSSVRYFKKSAALWPHYKTYELLGEACLRIGDHAEAVLYLSAACGLGRKQFRSRFFLAKALLALGPTNNIDAAMQLKKAIRLNPQYKAAKTMLSDMLNADENLAREVSEYE